jgi:hypothetical protein
MRLQENTMRFLRTAVLAALVTVIAVPVLAADEVFEGSLVCAKCFLKKADATECQDVLLVPDAAHAKAEYYITKNEVAKAAGEACTTEVKATVTGTVSEKDGRTWLTPSTIETR